MSDQTYDEARSVGETAAGGSTTVISPVRVVLAAASGAAAAIHFGMVPSHAAESTLEAIGFGVAGWIGVLFAVAVLLRPSRKVLVAGAVAHLAFMVIWLVSRTTGLPFGQHSGHAEKVTSIDVFATVLGGVVVVGAVALARTGASERRLSSPTWQMAGGFLSAVALVGATMALASPSARDHAAAGHGDHAAHDEVAADDAAVAAIDADEIAEDGHAHADEPAAGAEADAAPVDGADASLLDDGATTGGSTDGDHAHGDTESHPATDVSLSTRCDLAFNIVAYWAEMTKVHGGEAQAFAGSAELDELIRLTTKAGGAEAKDAAVVSALGRASDETYEAYTSWLQSYVGAAHVAHSTAAPDDNGGHGGHLGPQQWIPMTDQAECDQLSSELEVAKAVAMKYPNPTDAEAAGWRRVTGYVPGIAAHYMNFSYVDGEFNIDEPEMLLYDGTNPDSSMVGLSYYMIHDSDYEPTQGFTGPNDHFHRHVGLCVGDGGVIGDSATTAEECAAKGGVKSGGSGGWMNHLWIVPGCESPWGLFSGASPTLEGGLGQATGTDGGGCKGSPVLDRYDFTPGSADNVPPGLVGATAPAASS